MSGISGTIKNPGQIVRLPAGVHLSIPAEFKQTDSFDANDAMVYIVALGTHLGPSQQQLSVLRQPWRRPLGGTRLLRPLAGDWPAIAPSVRARKLTFTSLL